MDEFKRLDLTKLKYSDETISFEQAIANTTPINFPDKIEIQEKGSDIMKTITVDRKNYERKRYTLKELKDLFNGRVLVLEDATFENMNLVDGVLLEVCETKTKREVMKRYALEGRSCTFWDLSPEPILIGYKELITDAI